MSNQTILLVEATPNPHEEDARLSYLSKAPDIVKKHGGKPLARYALAKALDSGECPAAVVIFSFPNPEAITDVFDDPDYQLLVPLRDKGFSRIRFLVGEELVG